MKKKLIILAALAAFSNASYANLLLNGSFEDVGTPATTDGFYGEKGELSDGVTNPSDPNFLGQTGWLFDANSTPAFLLPGWADASGSTTEYYAEVRDNERGIGTAQDGSKFLELDTEDFHGGIQQTVNLAAGDYLFSFWHQSRLGTSNTNGNENQITGGISGGLNSFDFNADTTEWVEYTDTITVATAGNYTVSLLNGTTLAANSLGASIDNVSLTAVAVAAVPEPETYAMFLAGLGLLGFASRKQKS